MTSPEWNAEQTLGVLASLSTVLVTEDATTEDTLDRISHAAQKLFSGSAVSFTVVDAHRNHITHAASNPDLAELEDIQYRLNAGPCMDAIRNNEAIVVNDLQTSVYSDLAQAAKVAGYACALALPLRTSRRVEGALNLFATSAGYFDDVMLDTAWLLTNQAAFSLANAELYRESLELNRQLQEAIQSRAIVEQAKGVLIAGRQMTGDDAFEFLRSLSQSSNVKTTELARRLVDAAQSGQPLF